MLPDDEPLLEPYLRGDLREITFGCPRGGRPPALRFEPDGDGAAVELSILGERAAFRTNLRAPHDRLNLCAAAAVYAALGLPVDGHRRGRGSAASSRPGAARSGPGDAAACVIDDAYNANPVSMQAALEALVARADGRRPVAVLGEMAELGPDAPRCTARSASAATAGVRMVVGVGPLARGYGPGPAAGPRRTGSPTSMPPPRAAGPAPAGRRRAAQGQPRGRPRAPGRGHPVTHVLAAGVLATFLSIILGGQFICFLRSRSLGQHIREEGPDGHKTKQGTPTMGGLLIMAMTIIAFVPFSEHTGVALTVLLVTLACAGIGLLDDYSKIAHRRSLGLSGRWKLALLVPARRLHGLHGPLRAPVHAAVRAAARLPRRPRLGLVRVRLPRPGRGRRTPST